MTKTISVCKFLIAIVLIFIIEKSDAQNIFISVDYQPISHPRLLLLKGEENSIIEATKKEVLKMKVYDVIINESKVILSKSPIEHKLEGKRLLSQSQAFLNRIFYLSFAYRVTLDTRFAERAEKEMITVAAFPDWNPSHFLDVAEMTTCMAIGYDWLYQYLSTNSRNNISTSIINLGQKTIQFSKINKPNNYIWKGQGISPVACMRASWDDPDAIYVVLKYGSPSSSHAPWMFVHFGWFSTMENCKKLIC